MDQDGNSSKRSSVMWKHFIKRDNYIATCKVCKRDYSYRATVSNLKKHWKKCHGRDYDDDTDASDEELSNHSDDDSTKETVNKSLKSTWQYFEAKDNDKFSAKCKVCEKDVSYDSISDLREHAREHDAVISDDEDWGETNISVPKKKKKRSNTAKIWQYMRVIDKNGKNAACLICKKTLSYMSTTSNLKKHLRNVHQVEVNFDDEGPDAETKKLLLSQEKMLISQDGQLYEVATSDVETDPIHTDEIYLEDSMDGDIKTNFSNIATSTQMKKEKKIVRRKSTAKDLFPNTDNNINTNENTRLNTFNVRPNTAPDMSSIDYFGQYVVSLLKEMPKHVAGQLQSDIIKQIFTTKVALETPYTVTVNEKPVTDTVNNGIGSTIPEITVHNTGS